MKVSRLTSSGDWRFGRSLGDYARASDAIGQSIVTRLRSFKRDWMLDTEANVDWIGLLGTRGVKSETIRQQVERVIQRTEGVARINQLSVSLDRTSRRIAITANVVDVYQQNINLQGVEI